MIFSSRIGEKNIWKPVQSDILLPTKSVIDVAEDLLQNKLLFLLTSRLSPDFQKNVIVVVKFKHPIPTSLEPKNALKLITVS